MSLQLFIRGNLFIRGPSAPLLHLWCISFNEDLHGDGDAMCTHKGLIAGSCMLQGRAKWWQVLRNWYVPNFICKGMRTGFNWVRRKHTAEACDSPRAIAPHKLDKAVTETPPCELSKKL